MLERSFNYVSFPEFAARFWRIQVEIEIERERKSERNGGNHCPDSLSRGKLPTDRMLVANETSEKRKENGEKKIEEEGAAVFRSPLTFTRRNSRSVCPQTLITRRDAGI